MDAANCIARIDYRINLLSALADGACSAVERRRMSAEITELKAARLGWSKVISRRAA